MYRGGVTTKLNTFRIRMQDLEHVYWIQSLQQTKLFSLLGNGIEKKQVKRESSQADLPILSLRGVDDDDDDASGHALCM